MTIETAVVIILLVELALYIFNQISVASMYNKYTQIIYRLMDGKKE